MFTSKLKIEIEGNGFRNLTIFLLIYLAVGPLLDPFPSMRLLSHVSLTIVLFLAAYAVQKQQGQRPYVFAIIIPMLILYWLGTYGVLRFTLTGAYLLLVIYFGLLIGSYIMQIFRSPTITSNVLYAAFCLYLMIALLWGAAYALLEQLVPGSYGGVLVDGSAGNSVHIYNYLSIVTLTSLGYGDITPQTTIAAALCQYEAILGQFFTSVLVAWLVGNFVSEKGDSREAIVNGDEKSTPHN